MELEAIYQRVIGLDVHQAQVTACALIQQSDGSTHIDLSWQQRVCGETQIWAHAQGQSLRQAPVV